MAHSRTSLDLTTNRGRTTLDENAKIKSPLPHSIAVSKGLSNRIGTTELTSDGSSKSTSNLDASCLPRTVQERRIPQQQEEMDTRCTKCNSLSYSLQCSGKIINVPAAGVGGGIIGVTHYH